MMQKEDHMNNSSNEPSPEFMAEIDSIMKIIIERYHLKCTDAKDKNFIEEINRISRQYRNPDLPLVCEKVVADNLFIRRLILGQTLSKIASIAGVNVKTVEKYEAGKKKITRKVCEFAHVAIAYGYSSSDINEIFLYGASFHDLFQPYNSFYLCNKSELTFAPNLFFDGSGNISIPDYRWFCLGL